MAEIGQADGKKGRCLYGFSFLKMKTKWLIQDDKYLQL